MRTNLKHALLAVPLAGALAVALSACTPHERLHYGLNAEHEAYHATPHTRGEHRRFHEDLENAHREAHDRGYEDRYYGGSRRDRDYDDYRYRDYDRY